MTLLRSLATQAVILSKQVTKERENEKGAINFYNFLLSTKGQMSGITFLLSILDEKVIETKLFGFIGLTLRTGLGWHSNVDCINTLNLLKEY